jgi:hypothetical protein
MMTFKQYVEMKGSTLDVDRMAGKPANRPTPIFNQNSNFNKASISGRYYDPVASPEEYSFLQPSNDWDVKTKSDASLKNAELYRKNSSRRHASDPFNYNQPRYIDMRRNPALVPPQKRAELETDYRGLWDRYKGNTGTVGASMYPKHDQESPWEQNPVPHPYMRKN